MVSGGESDPEEPVPSERGEEELGGRRELGILLGISASPGGTLAAAEPSAAQRHRLQMLGAIGAFIGNASRETRQIVAYETAELRPLLGGAGGARDAEALAQDGLPAHGSGAMRSGADAAVDAAMRCSRRVARGSRRDLGCTSAACVALDLDRHAACAGGRDRASTRAGRVPGGRLPDQVGQRGQGRGLSGLPVQLRCARGSGRPGRQLQRGGRDVSAPRRRVGGPGRALSSGQGSELIVRSVRAGTREGDAAPEAGLVSAGYRDPI